MRRALLLLLALTLPHTPALAAAPTAIFTPEPAPRAGTLAARPAAGVLSATVDAGAVRAFRAAGGGRLAVPLPGGSEPTLALERFEVLAPGARVVVVGHDGETAFTPDLTLFKGAVEGEPGSWAVVSMSGDRVLGVISTAAGRFEIAAPRTTGGPHVIGTEQALAPEGPAFRCAAPENPMPAPTAPRGRAATEAVARPTATRHVCNLAVDCDYEYYAVKFGGDLTAATNYLLTILGTTSLIYERDLNTSLQVGFLCIWTTPDDPWTRGNMMDQLEEFRTWWWNGRPGVTRNLAFLVCGHSLGGGAAYIDALCSTTHGYGVAEVSGWYSYPTNSTTWDVNVLAHEIGHNFGSRHTHSCYWQESGFAPAGALLDSCYAAEGACYTGPTGIVPPDRGTIMSYCHTLPPGMSNIRLDFHPASAAAMRARAQSTCLAAAPVQPPLDLLATQAAGANLVGWTPSPTPGVIRYDVYRSAYRFDLDPARIGSSTGTSFVDPTPGDWSYKARAFTGTDSSAFSGEARPVPCGPRGRRAYGASTRPVALLVEDLDENGLPDLVIADSAGSRVVVLRGVRSPLSTDDYDTPRYAPLGAAPRALASGDFNHDGITDLAVVGRSLLTVLRGQGAGGIGFGTFTTGSTLALADTAPAAIVTADFDEDGIADLAVAGAAGLTVLKGQGSGGTGGGTFALQTTIPLGAGTAALTAGDFDADGITDLAVARAGSVAVLLGRGAGGKGDGTFDGPDAYGPVAQPSALVSGDFDQDGVTDLAVADVAGDDVAVLLGHGSGGAGDGTFGPAVTYACGPRPVALAVGDLDEDGLADLATADAGDTTISFLPGAAGGGFATARAFAAGGTPRALAVRDLDEDGRPDVVVANGVTPGTVTQLVFRCVGALASDLAITAPEGGEQWITGQDHAIAWTKGPGVTAVNLDLSRDRGVNWRSLATGLTGTGFTWTVTEPYTARARFRVWDPAVPLRVAATDSSLTIVPAWAVGVERPAPPRLALKGARPNPARGGLTVSFSLDGRDPARLELFDLAGRRVRALEVGGLGPGPHRVDLAGGAPLGAGVYLVRLTQAGRSESVRAVVLR